MTILEPIEKMKLEKLFGMNSGWVLDFSNRTFSEFFAHTFNINIYDAKYEYGTGSKANRLRAFWDIESKAMVGESIIKILELWETENLLNNRMTSENDKILSQHCKNIADKLIKSSGITAITMSDIEENKFLEKEYKKVDAKTLNVDPTMTDAIEQRINEIQICLNNNASLAAIFLIGSTLEGLLIDLANKNIKDFNQATSSPKKDGKVLKFNNWTLSSLIDTANELNFINEDVKKHSHSLRDFRNYIHPLEQVKSKFNPNKHTALISWQVLQAAINNIANK